MSEALAERVMTLIAESQQFPREQITLDSSFEALGMDSLDAVSAVAELENEFNIEVPNELVLRIRTVREAMDAVALLVVGSLPGPSGYQAATDAATRPSAT